MPQPHEVPVEDRKKRGTRVPHRGRGAGKSSSATGTAVLICAGLAALVFLGSTGIHFGTGGVGSIGGVRGRGGGNLGQPAVKFIRQVHPDHSYEHFLGTPPQPPRLPPKPLSDPGDQNYDAASVSSAMGTSPKATATTLRQPSSWVDGEKRLKEELSKLQKMQDEGVDLGAKVLTRWLGDSIPAWATKEDEPGWKRKVDARMAELRTIEKKFWGRARDMANGNSGAADDDAAAAAAALVNEQAEKIVHSHDPPGDFNGSLEDDDNNGIQAVGNDGENSIGGNPFSERGRVSTDESPDKIGIGEKKDSRVNDTVFGGDIDSNDMRQNAKDRNHMFASFKEEYRSPAAIVGKEATVLLRPTFGEHRPDADAVFAFAEGYDVKIYLAFVESLKETGFEGDIVLSVSVLSKLKPGVEEYLRAQPNIVVYSVEWNCFTGSGEKASGPKEGMRMCQLDGLYGDVDANAFDDPREARPVATARYELYWSWSLAYEPHTWIMLIDSRDTFFQVDPFRGLPKRRADQRKDDGSLYLFEENAETTTIGESSYNKRWLENAYGKKAVSPFFDKPVVCSGSTMGEKVAVEAYLRAMVKQFDDTKCKIKGCDQGFHNYLYYSGKLGGVPGIHDIVVHEQGNGIINNLGLLRDNPLKERGLLQQGSNTVLNWDGSVSPVAHQFDRDDELKGIINERKKKYLNQWREAKGLRQENEVSERVGVLETGGEGHANRLGLEGVY